MRTANPLLEVWQEQHWYGEPGLIKYSFLTERRVSHEDERGNPLEDLTLRTVVVGELLSFELR